jgi:hypothetical protein
MTVAIAEPTHPRFPKPLLAVVAAEVQTQNKRVCPGVPVVALADGIREHNLAAQEPLGKEIQGVMEA